MRNPWLIFYQLFFFGGKMQGWNNPFYYGNINKKIWWFRHVYLLFINKICPVSIYNRREEKFRTQTK